MELALTLPVLVVALLAVVQVARVAADQVALHHAVREAARAAAVDPAAGRAADAAAGATPELDPARLAVDLDGGRRRGDLLTVRARYRSPTGVPVVGRMLPDVDLTATAVVRVE